MDIIEKVSIGGMAFQLKPDAYSTLKDYLDKIKDFYSSRESGNEIVDGIESRIAELLEERMRGDGIVDKSEVDEIISIMGMPEEMDAAESKSGEDEPKEKKRLYRDPKQGIIGGVCSGLANYFKTDVVLVRLIFVALFALTSVWVRHGSFAFGMSCTMPLIYLVLLICTPAAKTVQEQWAMKGQDGSARGVEKSVMQYGSVSPEKRKDFWDDFGNILTSVIGILLLFTGIAGLVTGIAAPLSVKGTGLEGNILGFLGKWGPIDLSDWEIVPGFFAAMDQPLVYVCLALIVLIPFVAMIWAGIQMSFKLKYPKWHPGLIMFILWFAAILTLGVKIAVVFLSGALAV